MIWHPLHINHTSASWAEVAPVRACGSLAQRSPWAEYHQAIQWEADWVYPLLAPMATATVHWASMRNWTDCFQAVQWEAHQTGTAVAPAAPANAVDN